MPSFVLTAPDRPEVPPLSISGRLRGQLVYFVTPPDTPGLPTLGPDEVWINADDAARWLDEGVFSLISPLDTANRTECELTEEQERMLEWLIRHGAQRLRLTTPNKIGEP